MADQHDSWDEMEVQWGNTAPSRNCTKETSRPSGLGPATNCKVGGDLEPTSATGIGVVQWDNTILQLAVEDSDATLPYSPKQWTFTVSGADTSLAPRQEEAYSFTLASKHGASIGSYVSF